ncbi:MAG: sodium:calcium antiporter, partial [bacterium]|nr:sodium:calcium antiporter [bacterium]
IILGSNFVVDSATEIAKIVGVSERVISLSIIALGTSLPELVTTIVASRKNETDLILGNILGSNIFNICIVLGLPVAIFGGIPAASFTTLDLTALVLSAAALFVFSANNHKINRIEGVAMLAAATAYYFVVFV